MVEARGQARILIVDDEPQIRGILRELFSEDHKCVEAASAEESLDLLRTEQFDLILTDIVRLCCKNQISEQSILLYHPAIIFIGHLET